MSPSRYNQSRTLVRRLCRLPGEEAVDFKAKIRDLKGHFEQFNVDVSELCQWIMGLRKHFGHASRPESFGVLGDFLLEPNLEGPEAEEANRDRWRLRVFDDVAGFRANSESAGRPIPDSLRQAMNKAAAWPPTTTTRALFDRLRGYEPAHRLVLLKSAAEWIVARFQRGMANWVRNRAEWEKEKGEWEKRHPQLTEEVRERFTDVFRHLQDPAETGRPGVRRKNPRICPYERQRGNLNNCAYAGEKGHDPLCWRYADFVKDWKTRWSNFNPKRFAEDVEKYLPLRRKGLPKHKALSEQFKKDSAGQQRFTKNWEAYLQAMRLNESTVVGQSRMPHCLKIGGTGEKSECTWNPHTHLCKLYKAKLDPFDDETLKLELLYREWRKNYLAGPRKPSFRYPSARDLPMPKIFGEGFHEIDFDRSIVRLRLDNMAAGQWLKFGFTPWPRGYRPSRQEVKDRVTSVHVHFVGTRARAGFRFDVPHGASRFGCSQDELDELRSRKFPRPAQDQEFLDAARKRLLESFSGGPEKAERELRLLAVDLGDGGATASVFCGRQAEKDIHLPIVKINRLYERIPERLEPDGLGRPAKQEFTREDPRGVRKEHVARHLERIAQGAAAIGEHRRAGEPGPVTLGDHDFRGLKRHVAWMIRDWARLNARRIIAVAEEQKCDLIVFESLRGFLPPGYERQDVESMEKKRRMAMFNYGRIRRKVVEKAVERGMRVVTVPYFKSSQHCWKCGKAQENLGLLRKNKKERTFKCEKPGCKNELHSDANAARVLGCVFWNEIRLPTRQDGPGAIRS